ncbi:phosphinothricin acetyltransferase [Maricaulis sp. W15]|uniref:GNAT family N-acetyltransferase n=1 Tax=Maricaulis sp. W15 TaxID=1772333 RepID=UPI000948EA9B|nr:GNAT family N-acetyltransferase [Maricaulis sp. W15]OLF73164.1 phosphinothricin acetyltransferase [Maricaulis sp. W15]
MTTLRTMTPADAADVLAIYAEGIATGHASFESAAPDWVHFDDSKLAAPRLVALDADGAVTGWAALSPVSSRCVYGGVGEVSVYVAEAARGQGLGRTLLQALIEASEAEGLWTLTAGIFAENTASIRLHEQCGFERLGVRRGLGKMGHGPMAGQWRDVVQMERRSDLVGVD